MARLRQGFMRIAAAIHPSFFMALLMGSLGWSYARGGATPSLAWFNRGLEALTGGGLTLSADVLSFAMVILALAIVFFRPDPADVFFLSFPVGLIGIIDVFYSFTHHADFVYMVFVVGGYLAFLFVNVLAMNYTNLEREVLALREREAQSPVLHQEASQGETAHESERTI